MCWILINFLYIILKMYIIFGGFTACDNIFPERGGHDIIEIYQDNKDAIAYVSDNLHYDWLHIYDTETRKIIWNKDNKIE